MPRRPIIPPWPPGPEPHDDLWPLLFEEAARDHRLGAFHDLLGRLEDKHVFAIDVPDPVDQGARDADHDRHVRVVAARVHPAVGARGEVDARFFVDGQRIDVGAEHHGLARPARVQHRDSTRLRRTGLEVETELAQPFLQIERRLVLAEADLGVLVEIPPQVDDVVEHGLARQRRGRAFVSHVG